MCPSPPDSGAAPTKRRPGRPRGGQAVATREQLLDAAIEVIRASGPESTMDDIAAAAGVTKPVLYRTIGDKEAFVGALSEVMVDAMRTAADVAVQSLADAPESDPPPEGIDLGREIFRAALHGCLVAIDRDRNLFAFVNAGGPGTASFRSLVDRSSVELVDQFAELRRNADLDPAPSRTWAYAIVGAIQVVAMMWLRDEFRDLDAVADDLAGLMWPGVTSSPAR